jgi:hypothetical protein
MWSRIGGASTRRIRAFITTEIYDGALRIERGVRDARSRLLLRCDDQT